MARYKRGKGGSGGERGREGETDKTDRQTRQTDRQTDRQTYRQTDSRASISETFVAGPRFDGAMQALDEQLTDKSLTHSRIPSQTHARTHARTHAHTYTRTHTHTQLTCLNLRDNCMDDSCVSALAQAVQTNGSIVRMDIEVNYLNFEASDLVTRLVHQNKAAYDADAAHRLGKELVLRCV